MEIAGQFYSSLLHRLDGGGPAFFEFGKDHLALGFFEHEGRGNPKQRMGVRFGLNAEGQGEPPIVFFELAETAMVWPVKGVTLVLDPSSFQRSGGFAPTGSIVAAGDDLYILAVAQDLTSPISYSISDGQIRNGRYTQPFYSRWSLLMDDTDETLREIEVK